MKSGKYLQLYIHLVFAVKYREALLHKEIREKVFEYISGTIRSLNHKSIIVNGYEDHVHILINLNPNKTISDTVRDIKRSSALMINSNNLCKKKFAWQEGYGAFSYSHSHVKNVYKYIEKQEEHHNNNSFKKEYLRIIDKYECVFNEKNLFCFIE